jgi:Outer membrane lipoprotein-sorting protein
MPDASNIPAKPTFIRVLRMVILLLAFFALRQPILAAPPTPEQEQALAATRQRVQALDYRASGRLTRIDAAGKRTNNKFSIKGHWFPDGMRLLVEITDPVAGTLRILLHMTANGRVTIDAAPAGSKAATPLPFERWTEGLLGSDFSYEDLLETQFFWKNQEFLPPADYSSRKCFVLKSVPDATDRSHYNFVTSWVDRDIFYPVHVIKTMRSGQQKEFNYFGFQQNSGAWSATHLEVKVPGTKASSVFVVERGSGKAKLTLKDFDLTALAGKQDKSVSP